MEGMKAGMVERVKGAEKSQGKGKEIRRKIDEVSDE